MIWSKKQFPLFQHIRQNSLFYIIEKSSWNPVFIDIVTLAYINYISYSFIILVNII